MQNTDWARSACIRCKWNMDSEHVVGRYKYICILNYLVSYYGFRNTN